MKAKAPAFQFYPKDWLADAKVRRLSWAAKGVYVEILALMWNEGKDRLPNDADLPIILGISDEDWRNFFDELQRDGKKVFIEKDGFVISKRLREERRKQRKIRAKRKSAAQKRWGCKSNASAMQMECLPSASSSASASSKKDLKQTKKTEVVFPDSLNTEEFKTAWAEWLEYKRQRKESYKPLGEQRQLARIAKWGIVRATAAIEYSIAQNYQGLYEESHGRNQRTNTKGDGRVGKAHAEGFKAGVRVDA